MQELTNLQDLIFQDLKSDGFTEKDIFRSALSGKLTDEQREYYITHYMTEEEKAIGKPLFEMNKEEQNEYDALLYNNSEGCLTGYDCKICKNKGDIKSYPNGYETYVDCDCKIIRKVIETMEKSGLGNLLAEKTFDKYECTSDWQTDIVNKAKTFVNDKSNRWFVLLGESGAGKSHICTAISRELLKQRLNLVFMEWVSESTELKQIIHSDGERYNARIKELKNADVLYIDDLFKTDEGVDPTAADKKLAYEILNYRYNKARIDKSKRWVTIISSEKHISELLNFDKAVAGRIVEMSNPDYLIAVKGIEKNYRLKGL